MSQHINPTPKQTAVDSVNSKIGNVGSTDLQAQITSLNSKFSLFQMRYLNQSTDDLNNLYNTSDSGLYLTGGSALNSPVPYCAMLVIARNGTCAQILFSDYIYTRNRFGTPPAWSAWRRVHLETY